MIGALAPAQAGTVHLVGAGPGDPGLLTLRGARLLETADVVAVDRLVAPELRSLAPPTADIVDVGKRPGGGGWTQAAIADLLVARARAGAAVVRVKGGDPYVFGRGSEEAAACVTAGVPFEVVPGVSSAFAAPAAAGVPLTHRGLATGFAVVTGHEDPAKPHAQTDWPAVARFPGTLVVLMGVAALGRIVGELLAAGRAPTTPAAAVRWGTTPEQEVVEAALVDLPATAAAAGLRPPATIVIGDVVGMRSVLAATPALVGAA